MHPIYKRFMSIPHQFYTWLIYKQATMLSLQFFYIQYHIVRDLGNSGILCFSVFGIALFRFINSASSVPD